MTCGGILSGCEKINPLTPKLAGLALMCKGPSRESEMLLPLLEQGASFSILGEAENRQRTSCD